jgi:hypothetical protein
MAIHNPMDRGSGDPITTDQVDTVKELAVLDLVLKESPDQLTAAELAGLMGADPGDFGANDALERAVKELIGGGLLRQNGKTLMPTQAARAFNKLAAHR